LDSLTDNVKAVHVTKLKNEETTMKARLIRKPEKSEGSTAHHAWLTPEALGKSGKGTIILSGNMRSSKSEFGEGIVLDVKVNGAIHAWTVRYDTPNYSKLHERFGDAEKNWKGAVKVEVKEHKGKEYVAVV
jgi:hypothetical protein